VLPFVSNEVIRPKYRLILYFAASCLPSVPDRSTRLHIKLSLHWAWLHHVYVRQYTGILAPLVLFGTHSRPQVSPPSQCPPPATLATSFRTLTFIIK
jgi:hypothetical protein